MNGKGRKVPSDNMHDILTVQFYNFTKRHNRKKMNNNVDYFEY